MRKAAANFGARTNEAVLFGVGTFALPGDVQEGLGACIRLQVNGLERDLLVQVVNTGGDVAGFQFDLQVGNGGFGNFNSCTNDDAPGVDAMFPGTSEVWGKKFGGADHRKQCASLPRYPVVRDAMAEAGDDLVSLCEYSFDHGVRVDGGHTAGRSILSMGRVECPHELVELTQIRRRDDPSGFSCGNRCTRATQRCTHGPWCLTRMMDCRKPSGSIPWHIKDPSLMVHGHRLVQPCGSDGYTRIDVQCGCKDCWC